MWGYKLTRRLSIVSRSDFVAFTKSELKKNLMQGYLGTWGHGNWSMSNGPNQSLCLLVNLFFCDWVYLFLQVTNTSCEKF